jgi:deoxyribodipyrimidine photo-lyase
MQTVIFWFRRDLRLEDHAGLAAALATGAQVIPVYVVDPAANPGGDIPATRTVMWRGLHGLDQRLQAQGSRLLCRRGDAAAIIPELVRATGAAAVFASRKQGAYFTARDERVRAMLGALGVPLHVLDDDTIVPLDALRTATGGPFAVYTPFSKQWLEWLRHNEPGTIVVPLHRLALAADLRALPGTVTEAFGDDGPATEKRLPAFEVSTTAARERLAWFVGQNGDPNAAPIARYHEQRDLLGVDGTSRLSLHLAWGTISARAVYLAALAAARGGDAQGREGCRTWVAELGWRDFYHHILLHAPYAEQRAYQQPYAQLAWEGAAADFDAWVAGRTGYPVVDAAMRQIGTTGWMHNRARMIVASFLVKDLLLNWQLGETYFAQRLIDHDVASNNGGWQWSAGTGTDPQPYFRVFNPVLQGERFDANGDFVRQWVPELATVPPQAIHAPWKLTPGERRALCPDYPPPLVDHFVQRGRAIAMFRAVRNGTPQALSNE